MGDAADTPVPAGDAPGSVARSGRIAAPADPVGGRSLAHLLCRPRRGDPIGSRRQERQRGAHPLFERGAFDRRSAVRGTASLVGSAPQAAQRRANVLGLPAALVLGCALLQPVAERSTSRRRPCATRLLALSTHEFRSKRALRFELIVGAAAEPYPMRRRLPPSRERLDVIELEKAAGFAAVPAGADEGATSLVPHPDCAADVDGNVTSRPAVGTARARSWA
jgi:hypothetical protein